MRRRLRRGVPAAVAAIICALTLGPATVVGASSSPMTADLDGRPIALSEVAKHSCHDIDYPRIHCFATQAARDASAAPLLASSSATYVIVWEDASYAGSSLIISQDYTVLATLGWNDRISSYKAQNSLTGRFWTDWFYFGTAYYFCCNQQVPLLGVYNDTFSSVQHL
jgi:hypothetical protein